LLGFYVEPEPEEELFERAGKAEASYRAALAASPDAALAAFRLGRLLASQGKTTEALRWLDQAIARRPEWSAAHLVRARTLQGLKRGEEAVRALEDAAAADPDGAAAALMIAVEIEEARGSDTTQLVRRAAAANPTELGLCLELARRLSNSGQRAEASALLMKAFADRQQGNGQLLAALSSSLRSEGHDAESLEAAREAAAAEPDSPDALSELAAALRQTGDLAQALETYRHWRDVAPGDAMALREEGLALADAGRLTEAIKAFRVYYDMFPDRRQDAARFLGRALALSGRRGEAIPLLREAGLAEEAAAIERGLPGRPEPPHEP
jgi:tetratricopeptide (TPR) repeat protein